MTDIIEEATVLPLKIYTDSALKSEVQDLDLGTVQAGDQRDYVYYILNDSPGDATRLTFTISHNEVQIIDAPLELKAHDYSILKIRWKASVTIKAGVRAKVEIRGAVLYQPPAE